VIALTSIALDGGRNYKPTIRKEKEKIMIGLSLSFCIADILTGKVKLEDDQLNILQLHLAGHSYRQGEAGGC